MQVILSILVKINHVYFYASSSLPSRLVVTTGCSVVIAEDVLQMCDVKSSLS